MNLEEKRKIYLERFPGPLGRRMAEQVDGHKVKDDCVKFILIDGFASWGTTKEGSSFWKEMCTCHARSAPTEAEIKAVFERHNIEYR